MKKGDLLFTIDPRPYQAALDQAKAELALDQSTLKRQQELRAKNVTRQQELDTAQANARQSEAAAEAAQVNLDHCYIKSPIDGRADCATSMSAMSFGTGRAARRCSRFRDWIRFTPISPSPSPTCHSFGNISANRT